MMRILLVEDERDLAEPLVELLRRERYEVVWADGLEAARKALDEFDLAILDVMLSGSEDAGFELAQNLREAEFRGRVLFLTARDSIEDRIRGLNVGDDYLIKPFSLHELLARVQALLRQPARANQEVCRQGPLYRDLDSRRVTWEGRELELSDRELALLELFELYPGRAFSADELLARFFSQGRLRAARGARPDGRAEA